MSKKKSTVARSSGVPKEENISESETIKMVKAAQLSELGVTGLTLSGRSGVVDEEFLQQLKGDRGRKVFREMRDNDPIIGAIMFAIEMLIRQSKWDIEGDVPENVDFLHSCLDDMSHTWESFISEAMSMLTFGFSFHEIIYKQRLGVNSNPSKNSKFNDGKYGWRKIPIRAQETLYEWEFDQEGGVQAFIQTDPQSFQNISIPLQRGVLFRTTSFKNNPEGRSVLRNSYRPWFFKKRIEEIEGIGVERDLAGLPVIYRDDDAAKQYDASFEKILSNIRRDEQEGVLMPLSYDASGNKRVYLELLSSSGSRQFDTNAIVDRYNRAIAVTVLADFILMGQQRVGSFALASTKTQVFATAIGAFLSEIASVMNRYAIPRLFLLNSVTDSTAWPKMIPKDVQTPDLDSLSKFITALSGAGAPLFPNDKLQEFLMSLAHLPQGDVTDSQTEEGLEEE